MSVIERSMNDSVSGASQTAESEATNEKQEEDGRDEPSGLVSLIHLPYSLMVSPRVSNKEAACRTTSRLTTDESALDMRTSALFMVVSLQPGGPVVCCNYSPDLWGYINELSA